MPYTQSLLAIQNAISAGTISLGGGIGYSRDTQKDAGRFFGGNTVSQETTYSRFSFIPSAGYFVADNLAIGLDFGYSAQNNAYTRLTPAPATVLAELDPTTVIRVGPYVQYYKMLGDQFGILGTLSGGYQRSSESNYSRGGSSAVVEETKGSGYYASLTPGVIFFPVPKFGISASIGSLRYSRMSYDFPTNRGTAPDGYENITSRFGLGFGLDQLQFEGTFFLGR